MRNFKKYTLTLLCMLALMAGFISCKKSEGFNEIVSKDQTKPGVVTDIKVENRNGESIITYKLPNTDNLLYVLAKYKINDKASRETKASYYTDTIVAGGFAKSQEYDVTLYSVSRANVMSDPVTVKVHPDTPVYQLVRNSINLSADFGGITYTGSNTFKKPVGVILVERNRATNAMEIVDQFYTQVANISHSIRGYDTVGRDFGIYLTDQYGNRSDTLIQNISPLYEELINKSKFFTYRLNSDADLYTFDGWAVDKLWDTKTEDSFFSPGWHTVASSKGLPMNVTFGLGQTAKLSRFVLFNRPGDYSFNGPNAKVFSVWGSLSNSPGDAVLPMSSPEGTVIGDWVNIMNCRYPDPPSGNSPRNQTAADKAFVAAGVSFAVPITAPKVKFIRMSVSETWVGGGIVHATEISLYGKAD